ncbi:MAG: DNA polymerase domain-containing protein [Candidatus Bathyarchaeia archaeon]
MSKIFFWLLDINHEVVDGNVEVRMWGKDGDGKTVLLVSSVTPYFYVLPKGNDVEAAASIIRALKEEYGELVDAEVSEKRYFGKPVKTVKVSCKTPDGLDRLSRILCKAPYVRECFEDDIRPAARYIIDSGLNPSGWYEVEVRNIPKHDFQVDRAYEAVKTPLPVWRLHPPDLRVLAFSTVYFSERGSPDPDKDPILVVSISTMDGGSEQYTVDGDGDGEVLKRFISRLRKLDPDIVVGWGQNSLDWDYMLTRSRKSGVKLSVDRCGGEPHRSTFGHISITGRANIDLANIADDMPEVKVEGLGGLAEFLGVARKDEVDRFQDVETGILWKSSDGRRRLIEYSKFRSEVTLRILNLLIDYAIQMSHLTGLPLDQVAAAAVGFRVDSYLMAQAHRLNELIPKRTEQPYIPYQGAIVMEPKPGVHEDVAVLDFTSMYPNLMIMYNISPDSFIGSTDTSTTEFFTAPEVGFKFRKDPPGFYKKVLQDLINVRREIKSKMSEVSKDSVEYKVLRERERVVKIVTNACYGYAGWIGARWYVREVAESVAAFGRASLRRVISIAKDLGLQIIYGDTDSIFVKYEPEKVEELLSIVGREMGMEIKVDKVYSRVLFTEAKKKYAGLLSDGTLDIVGLEVVRGDWSKIAKTVQERILEIVLREGSVDKAVEYLRHLIRELRAGKIPVSELAVWKTLTKPVESYQVKSPHVEVARMMLEDGWRLKPGDKVGFVIVKGPGRLYQKARPIMNVTLDKVDLEYYVGSQVLPAAMRILGVLGVDESVVSAPSGSAGLSGYIGKD